MRDFSQLEMTQTEIKAYACCAKGEQLKPWSYKPRPLGETDIHIKIAYCGICASDIHTLTSGWGPTAYPVVVGHEIVGEVVAAGSKVKRFQVGDKVGVGAMVWACKECDVCKAGNDQLCPKRVFTYNDKYGDGGIAYGGYAEAVRVCEEYAFKIPEGLDLQHVAPLLCAGVTVFSPLDRFKVKQGMRVGVVGIGGLGHLAVQFAHKLGAEVTAVSHSLNKKDEAKQLGASHFVNINDKESLKAAENTLDVLLITSNHKGQPWGSYLGMMKRHGNLVLLALPEESLSIMPSALILKEVSMTGSLIGSQATVEKMLAFSAKHKVLPWIETCNMSQVNEAIDKVHDGKVRYRMVMKPDLE